MKLPVKSTSISLGVIGLTLVGGIIIASHPGQPAKIQLYKATADTVASSPTDTSATPASTSPQTATAATTATAPTSASPSQMPANTPSSLTSASTTATSTAPTTTTAPAVTAVSAEISNWSDPVPTASMGSTAGPNGPIPMPTTVKYQYCVWTYSDGSTQKKVYRTTYTVTNNGTITGINSDMAGYDCIVANAPASS